MRGSDKHSQEASVLACVRESGSARERSTRGNPRSHAADRSRTHTHIHTHTYTHAKMAHVYQRRPSYEPLFAFSILHLAHTTPHPPQQRSMIAQHVTANSCHRRHCFRLLRKGPRLCAAQAPRQHRLQQTTHHCKYTCASTHAAAYFEAAC